MLQKLLAVTSVITNTAKFLIVAVAELYCLPPEVTVIAITQP